MSTEQNEQVFRRYHDLKPEEMDAIITKDFIGRGPKGSAWMLEMHKKDREKHRGSARDTIHEQVAEGDLVATRFTREGMREGKRVKASTMSVKGFEGGKIAEIWELWVEGPAE